MSVHRCCQGRYDIAVHRSLVEEDRARDCLVTAPAGDQLQYFNMARGQGLGEKRYLSGSGWLAGDKIGSLVYRLSLREKQILGIR